MTTLEEHMTMIVTTTSHLGARLQAIDHKLRALPEKVRFSVDNYLERSGLEKEKESIEQCLRICAEASKNVVRRMQELAVSSSNKDAATFERQQGLKDCLEGPSIDCQNPSSERGFRINVFEDIIAASESSQVIAAAPGNLIAAARVTAQTGATQWMGQLSDAILAVLLEHKEGNRIMQ